MGFLTNLFKSKELVYVEQLWKDCKEDKARLILENNTLREEVQTLNNKVITLQTKQDYYNHNIKNTYADVKDVKVKNSKLSPKEETIYNLCEELKDYHKVLDKSKMKEASFKVYISRIKKKGYDLNL